MLSAAFAVQSIVASYERHLAHADGVHGSDSSEDRGKECSNLVVLLSELYNFQVIACVLIYDLIRELLNKDFSEIRVELLLKILKSERERAVPGIRCLHLTQVAGNGYDRMTLRH